MKRIKKLWNMKLTFGGMFLFMIIWDLGIKTIWQALANWVILNWLGI